MLFHNSFFKNLQNLEMFLLQKLRLMYACLSLNTVVSLNNKITNRKELLSKRYKHPTLEILKRIRSIKIKSYLNCEKPKDNFTGRSLK